MTKKQNKLWKELKEGVAWWGFLSFFLFLPANAAQVEVQPNFLNDYLNFLKALPAPTALNGGGGNDLEEIVPPFKMPFAVFKFDWTGENKQSFSPGESVSLTGKLSYSFKGEENLQKIKNICLEIIKDEKKCQMPPIYEVPQFSKVGVFVQVWRKDPDKTGAEKGDFLVDEFYALEDKSLTQGESLTFPIKWQIPQESAAGDYYLSLYLNQDKYFDLAGTPLTVFSEAKKFDFAVKNEGENKGIEIDKNNIKINGQEFAYRRPAPTVKGEMINLEIPLRNLNQNKEPVAVKFELYRWGQTDPKNLIKTETQNKTLEGKSQEVLRYSFVPDGKESVLDLKVSATNGKSTSVSNIRFTLEEKKRGIFRFLSFVQEQGKLLPVFCVRNANWTGNFSGKVKLSLGNNVWEKEGDIEASEGRCFLLRDQKMQAGEKCSVLQAEIQDKTGFVTEKRELAINCAKAASPEPKNTAPAKTPVQEKGASKSLLLLLFLTALVLLGVFVVNNKVNNKKK